MRWINVLRDQMLGLLDLFVCGRPAQDRLDLVDHLIGNTRGLSDMRLLGQVLGQQLAGGIDRPVVVVIHRTDDQLRAV